MSFVIDRSRRVFIARALTLLCLMLAVTRDLALAQTGYYQGKTVQLIVAFGTGGVTDTSARLVARYLGKHIPGNPNIIVQNMPGAGGITAANHLYNLAKPDGLTITSLGRANYLEQMLGKPEVRFDFRKFSWVGSFNNAPMMLACRADRGLTAPEKIRALKTAPRIGQGGSGSISTIFSSLVEEALNLKFHNVMGYKSGREIDLALERGEIDCRASSDITIIRSPWPEWLEKRFVTFLVQQGPNKSRVLPAQVPTVHALAPAGSKPVLDLMSVMLAFTEFDRPFAAPPNLPAPLLQILRDAFEKMLGDPGFAAEGKKLVDWDGSYLTGEQLQKRIDVTVSQPPDVVARIKQILQ
jgi:tripartite-type tricarboxylate transporter receptor subunit TctC